MSEEEGPPPEGTGVETGVGASVCQIVPELADAESTTVPIPEKVIFDPRRSKCLRCKTSNCPGINRGCPLQSDAFPARKKDTPCALCPKLVYRGDPITCLKRGQYSGSYVHLQCAWDWLRANPATTAPVFKFQTPATGFADFNQKFVRGQPGDDHFEGVVISTAGSGKTNGLVAACASLYELATSEGPLHGAVKAILVVFTREARAECVERGAAGNGVTKVTTFHSHGKVYITMWNRAMHKDRKIMAGKDPRDLSAFEPSVVKQKTRLVVSFYFRNFEHGEALTKLYREFVAKVMDLARQKAIGCPQEESFHNTETLSALVEEYNLAPVLASSWTGKLNQTEKLQLERKIGDESRRIDFGLKVAASCLDLSIQIGTQLTVDGCTHLYNEVTRELVPFPIVDQHDLVYLVVYLDLDLGMWTHVMVDEMQDVTRILYLFILQLVRRRANLLMVGDPAQSMYYWMGGDKATLEQMLHGREQHTHMLNYRSARNVIEATQPALAATGSTDTIVQIRDVDGEYRENVTFHSHPIVAGERTALLTRMAATVFEIYNVLLSKGYIHVKMVGRKSTRDNVLKLLGELEGPMSSVLTRLNLRLDSSAPASQNERHDTTLALQASITAWSKLASAGDIDALDSRTAYSAWLEKVYTEDAAAGDTLVVSTIHGYKGRQATRVCIFQPDHLPLPDRLRLEDDPWRSWEADEERCIFNVALSRAEDRLHLMVHLEDGANRTGLLTLWDAPADLETSQSTEATASIISSQESAGEPDEVDEATNGALAVLHLEAVPANLQELAAAVRQNLRAANSSIANFDSPAVQARTQECLGARRHLTKVITRRNLQRVDDAMALHH